MKKYEVNVEGFFSFNQTVEAKSKKEAEKKIMTLIKDSDVKSLQIFADSVSTSAASPFVSSSS